MEISISIDNIREAARQFISQMDGRTVFAFYGQMGAGKTTFIKAVCEEMGVSDVITSPTFAIVNEYSVEPSALHPSPTTLHPSPSTIYHFDFYRIHRLEEVYDMGYEEYFYSGSPCFIEWPELIEELLPPDAVRIAIEEQPDGTRRLHQL